MNARTQHFVDIVLVLIQKDLKVRYKNTIFGYLWSVGHPLAFALVFYIAFKVVIKIQVEEYVLFLITGLFPWQWFSNSISASPMVFLGNAPIIKKLNFPRNLIPFALVFQDMIHFIFSLPVVALFLFIYNKNPYISWLWGVPILLFFQFMMTYGFALIISSTNLFFRDLERLTQITLTLLFYFTPVIYPETMIPPGFHDLVQLNPLACLVIVWRNLLMEGYINWFYLSISGIYGFVFVILGYFTYKKLSWRFAEVL